MAKQYGGYKYYINIWFICQMGKTLDKLKKIWYIIVVNNFVALSSGSFRTPPVMYLAVKPPHLTAFLSLIFFINLSFANEITIIGDSLTVGAKGYLKQQIPDIVIDAKVGRKFQEALPVIKDLERKGLLGKVVVIALGTNGYFSLKEGLDVIDYLENKGREVIFVNVKVPRQWESQVNKNYQRLKELRPSIKVIDWHNESKKFKGIFRGDGYHLTKKGSYLFSKLIIKSIK